jgi:hypothetical protein
MARSVMGYPKITELDSFGSNTGKLQYSKRQNQEKIGQEGIFMGASEIVET